MQFLDKVVPEAAGVNIDVVVDVPVTMQRRSLHALSTEAFGRISTCSACLRCSLNYFFEPLVSGSHFPRCTCVRIRRLSDEFQPFSS